MLPRATGGFAMAGALKLTFETPIKNTVLAALLPRFLHAVAGGGHLLGDLAGADPLGMALDVRSCSVPRSSGLGGRQGEQGGNVPMGTEVRDGDLGLRRRFGLRRRHPAFAVSYIRRRGHTRT